MRIRKFKTRPGAERYAAKLARMSKRYAFRVMVYDDFMYVVALFDASGKVGYSA